MNSQYENEIETLLKFNERLLSIIESEINTVSVPIKHKDNASLQPISERSERESDLVATPVQSFIRNRKIVARSERGGPTKNSLVELGHISGNKLNLFEKSEVD